MQKYLLKVQQYNPSDINDKPMTVAAMELDMAQYAASAPRQALDLRLRVKENPSWSNLHGEVLLKLAVESRSDKVCPSCSCSRYGLSDFLCRAV